MNRSVRICYVDDLPDRFLSRYLYSSLNDNKDITYLEYRFSANSYDELLLLDQIRLSDIIVIDSKLFLDSSVEGEKLTGEQFKLIFQTNFPYKKTIVVSQNPIESDSTTISKYKSTKKFAEEVSEKKYIEYYDSNLKEEIETCILEIYEFRKQAKKLENNSEIDKLLKEKIDRNLNSIDLDLPIKKEDIDQLISLFKIVEKEYE